MAILGSLLKALVGDPAKNDDVEKKKLTQKEKDELEYQMWVMAEEYEEEE